MALSLVTAPVGEPVSLQEAKEWCRIDGTSDHGLLRALITAARQALDGRDGWLGRALLTQTWDLVLDDFPAWTIDVPLPPLQSVTSITYLDSAGVSRVLAASQYVVDAASQPGRLTPAYGETWPSTYSQINAVTLRFIAGYGNAAAVPEALKTGLKALIAHVYEHREPVVAGTIVSAIPHHVGAILAPYRIWAGTVAA